MGPPCWADGLAYPSLGGLDAAAAAQQARELVSRSAASLAAHQQAGGTGGVLSAELVDQVFALVQLALDDRWVRACMRRQQQRKYHPLYVDQLLLYFFCNSSRTAVGQQ